MGLIDIAAADNRAILTDVAGFAVPITITSPDGVSAVMGGLTNDVSLSIDPQTGIMVAGRRASVALSIAALTAAGLAEPRAISDKTKKPWVVSFTTPTGKALTFAVAEALPDELGCIVCLLETYTP